MINLEKLLDAESLAKSCPIPLPAPLLKSLTSMVPYFLKKHQVDVKELNAVDVATDSMGMGAFLGANENASIYAIRAEKDGAPVFALVFLGKKPQ